MQYYIHILTCIFTNIYFSYVIMYLISWYEGRRHRNNLYIHGTLLRHIIFINKLSTVKCTCKLICFCSINLRVYLLLFTCNWKNILVLCLKLVLLEQYRWKLYMRSFFETPCPKVSKFKTLCASRLFDRHTLKNVWKKMKFVHVYTLYCRSCTEIALHLLNFVNRLCC